MTLDIYSYSLGEAAQDTRSCDGPHTIQTSPLLKPLSNKILWRHQPLIFDPTIYSKTTSPLFRRVSAQLAHYVFDSTFHQRCFLTMGGDHSCAIGTWSGAAQALAQQQKELGLIWIDAHMDSHTHDTSMSHNIHGMSLAALLGHGRPALTNILSSHTKLKPENVCLIGIRSYEQAEQDLLERIGVKVFYMQEVTAKSLKTVLKEALSIVTNHNRAFGISIDIDGFDPKCAPAVATTVDNGLDTGEFIENIDSIFSHPQFIGAEIAEFNPSLDQNHITEKFIVKVITKILQNKKY